VLQGDIDNLHVEVELLFEDYLLQMDEVLVALRSVQSYVRNTEEVVEIELDLLRNRIMRYEMLLELSGLVVGVAAAVTGAFGMNLVSRLEEHPTMFYNVIGALLVVMAAMGYSILRKLSMDNIL
jgi:magnesium transporter